MAAGAFSSADCWTALDFFSTIRLLTRPDLTSRTCKVNEAERLDELSVALQQPIRPQDLRWEVDARAHLTAGTSWKLRGNCAC